MAQLKVSLENIIPLTEARDHFSQIVNEVQRDKLYVLTKGGKPAVAIIDVKYLETISGGAINTGHVEQEIQKDPTKVGRTPMIKLDSNPIQEQPRPSLFKPVPSPANTNSFSNQPKPAQPKPFTPAAPFTPTPSSNNSFSPSQPANNPVKISFQPAAQKPVQPASSLNNFSNNFSNTPTSNPAASATPKPFTPTPATPTSATPPTATPSSFSPNPTPVTTAPLTNPADSFSPAPKPFSPTPANPVSTPTPTPAPSMATTPWPTTTAPAAPKPFAPTTPAPASNPAPVINTPTPLTNTAPVTTPVSTLSPTPNPVSNPVSTVAPSTTPTAIPAVPASQNSAPIFGSTGLSSFGSNNSSSVSGASSNLNTIPAPASAPTATISALSNTTSPSGQFNRPSVISAPTNSNNAPVAPTTNPIPSSNISAGSGLSIKPTMPAANSGATIDVIPSPEDFEKTEAPKPASPAPVNGSAGAQAKSSSNDEPEDMALD